MEFVGRSGNDVLLQSGAIAVIVNEEINSVVQIGTINALSNDINWDSEGKAPLETSVELASAAVTSLDIKVFSNSDRMYTIPKAVQAEAKRALEWRKEEKRGGTAVGLNTARTLARGGQIGLRKVRHIAKYFPRHAVDSKAKGYRPGEEGYPSNGRIAWALWGGDAAERWASAIVDREDKTLSTYSAQESIELSTFEDSGSEDFFLRIFTDGSGFDRLYKVGQNESLSVWDDGVWYNLGEEFNSFSKIDSELDEEPVDVAHFHVLVDTETAILASAYLDQLSLEEILLSTLNAEEAELAAAALSDDDFFDEIDAITAAVPASPSDQQYTPEERAANASKQSRDATGRFARQGNRVYVGADQSKTAVITSVNGANVQVKYDDGTTSIVPAKATRQAPEGAVTQQPQTPAAPATSAEPMNVSGILADPKKEQKSARATLSKTSPALLTANNVFTLLADWPKWLADQRAKTDEVKLPQIKVNSPQDYLKAPNAYNDPYLRKWLDTKVKSKDGKESYPNRFWYQPMPESYKYATEKKKPLKSIYGSAEKSKSLTPTTSDVPPVYMAIVDKDDPQAVTDLISLIPADTEGSTPTIFEYQDGKWQKNEQILADLKSPTPPPVVVLDNEELSSVVEQMLAGDENRKQQEEAEAVAKTAPEALSVDGLLALMLSYEDSAILAAGGLDRNRGNAENLRRYWTVGKGGLKIRWGTGGDWKRCVRYLSKYLGPRAKGYCALRHKEMTGLWTGDKGHRQMYGRKGGGVFAMSDEMLLSTEEIIEKAQLRAQVNELKSRVLVASGGYQAPLQDGAKFIIPLVLPEGVETGDGRKFAKGAITMRELPLPLMWQVKTAEGHNGSVVVGRIDHMERIENGVGNAYGVFDTGEYGREAERLVRGGFIRGISADLDRFEAAEEPEEASSKEKKKIGQNKLTISAGRIMGVTLVPKPAFQECTIQLAEESDPVGMQNSEQDALVACASVVASIPVVPPKSWFEDPKLSGPTPLTVTDDGRVFGHIAAWHVDHIGLSFGTKPPRSRSGYAYFHTGVIRTDDGSDVPVGQLTLAGGHASLSADAAAAAKHYDDTASAFADVHAGEDAYGIWVSGALRPSITPEQVRAIRASAPSGDWRPIMGSLELVAVCQVNVPGFPIARARVASGQVYALVAAGASYLARIKADPTVLQQAENVKARFAAIRSEIAKNEPITAGVGMEEMSSESMPVDVLETLLASVIDFSYRAVGFHWNVTGEDFSQYHDLFGKIYEDAEGSIDPLAENIRKIGGFPNVSIAKLASESALPPCEVKGGEPKTLVAHLLMANEALIEGLNNAFKVFDVLGNEAICNFLADRLDMHHKWSWQLASSVTPDEIILSEDEGRDKMMDAVFSSLEDRGILAAADVFGNPCWEGYVMIGMKTVDGKKVPNCVPEDAAMAEYANASGTPLAEFRYFSPEKRKELAEKGFALPDGSYPIRNVSDLKNAIRAYGRSKPSDRAKVRAHIKKRARALGHAELIPDTFSIDSTDLALQVESLRSRINAKSITAAGTAGETDPKA